MKTVSATAVSRPRAGTGNEVLMGPARLQAHLFGPRMRVAEAGHVPSAVHQSIDGLYHEDGSFRSAAELRHVFASAVLEAVGSSSPHALSAGGQHAGHPIEGPQLTT